MRALFAAALAAGASYCLVPWLGWHPPAVAVWKASGVGLLALWAALRAEGTDGWLLAAVLGFGALGDALLELVSLSVGGVAFLAGHLLAIWLYRRHKRGEGRLVAVSIALGTPAFVAAVTRDVGAAAYALGLGCMAASAWCSGYRRDRVAAGALLFVASDLMIFARAGGLDRFALGHWLIWPLYFAGQVLIAAGVSGLHPKYRTNAVSY